MYEHGTPYESNNRYFSARVSVKYNNQFYTWDSKYVSGFSISENLSNGNALAMGTINSSRLELELVQITGTYEHRLYKNIPIKVELAVMDGLPAGASAFGLYSSRPSTGDEHRLYCVPSENTYNKYMYVDGAWETVTYADPYVLNLGVFYIDDVEFGEYHNNPAVKSAKITAYDGFYLTERKFTSALTNPTIRSLIAEIATTCGLIGYNSSDWSNSITVSAYPEDATMRTMIGYLAGLQGTCAYFNRDGWLGAKWYTKAQYTEDETTHDFVIGRDTQYANSFVFGKSSDISGDITIKYLESGTGDNIITYPNNGVIGESISFENPLMDATQLQAIYADKVSADGTNYKITYTPLSVKWKGNATIETGEIVKVETSVQSGGSFVNTDCYIMERTMTYDGGFSEEYKCYGENEQTISFSTNVTMQKLERKLTNMEQAIEEATSVISQTEGSVFELISANDPTDPTKNAGWLLYSTDVNRQNVIKATANGIGFSSNGGQSYNAIGMWIDSDGVGHILANDIVAGSVNTDKLVVGTSQNVGTLTQYINSTKQTADSAYNATVIPRFNTGGGQVARDYCLPQGVPSDFRIRPGATIIVHFTNSGKGSTTNAQKYLRVFHSATGTASSTSDCDDVYKNDGTLYGGIPGSAVITSVDLPIYYKGQPLMRYSAELWDADTDVAFTWSGSYWAMSYDIPHNLAEGASILSQDVDMQSDFITNYGVCTTAQGTAAKTVSISSVTSLYAGLSIAVRFKYSNTASSPTLNVSGTGAKSLKESDGSTALADWNKGAVVYLIYSGSYWIETLSRNDAMKIVEQCMNTNTTYVDGGNIYARSIYAGSIATGTLTANEIKSGSITADRLSVGTGTRQELLTNNEMADGVIGYSGINCSLSLITSSSPPYSLYASVSNSSAASVGQWVFLDYNQCYQLVARIAPYSVNSVGSNPRIGFIIDDTNYALGTDVTNLSSSTIGSGSYTVIQHQFRWRGSSGYYRVGVYWQHIYRSGGNTVNMNIDWISLVKMAYATAGSGSGNASGTSSTTRESWLKSSYQRSPYLIPGEDSQGNEYKYPTDFETASSLTVDEGGNLTTLGFIDTPLAKIGNIQFKEGYSVFRANTSYIVDTNKYNLLQSYAAFITPTGGAYPSTTQAIDIAQEKCAHLKLAYQDGDQDGTSITWGNEYGAYYTAAGMRVYLEIGGTSSITEISRDVSAARDVYGDNIGRSSENIKRDIEESKGVLDKFKDSVIYQYHLKSEVADKKGVLPDKKYGFVIERETPKELIMENGDSINLYSMASMNWKATQELIEKIEKLEAIVNDGNATK